MLYEAGEAVRYLYFPTRGVFSVTVPMSDGALVESATVGSEGLLGIEPFLTDHPVSMGRTLLLVPDGTVLKLRVECFRREIAAGGTLRSQVGRYAHAYLATVMQTAACSALHHVQQRCARWLLRAHDLMQRNELRLSHESLATMLGVTRPTISAAAQTLQDEGLISYAHGVLRICDREGLEAAACPCYDAIRSHFERVGLASS